MTLPYFYSLLTVLVSLSISSVATAAPEPEIWDIWNTATRNDHAPDRGMIDHSDWQEILTVYIKKSPDGINLFAYENVTKEDKSKLNGYLNTVTSIDPRLYQSSEQQAYWINLYNALTIKLILDNYPVESITELGESFFSFGPWDDAIAQVAGHAITLNDIEHRILRPIWKDPRIHFAVNCASLGCPDLQTEAFTAANTERLLNKGAEEYLSHPRSAHFTKNALVLSSLFDWYGSDFGDSKRKIITKLSEYAPAGKAEKLRSYKGRLDYEYDWSLNSTD